MTEGPRRSGRPRRVLRSPFDAADDQTTTARVGACLWALFQALMRPTGTADRLTTWLTYNVCRGDARQAAFLIRRPERTGVARATRILDALDGVGWRPLETSALLEDLDAVLTWPGSDVATFGARAWAGLDAYQFAQPALARLLTGAIEVRDRPTPDLASPVEYGQYFAARWPWVGAWAAIELEALRAHPQRVSIFTARALCALVGHFAAVQEWLVNPDDREKVHAFLDAVDTVEDAADRACGELWSRDQDPERDERALERARYRYALAAMLPQLPALEQGVVRARINGDDRPLAAIARQLGVSPEALYKAHERAVARLRAALPA